MFLYYPRCFHIFPTDPSVRGYLAPAKSRISHTYRNLTSRSRIFRLILEIHALKERTPAALHQLFRNHDSELP